MRPGALPFWPANVFFWLAKVPRRGVARLSVPPVPTVPVLLCRRNRGTATRAAAPAPRAAPPSRPPPPKFIFGVFGVLGLAVPAVLPAPPKFIFGVFGRAAGAARAALAVLPAPLKFIFGVFGRAAGAARAALAVLPAPLKLSFSSCWPERQAGGRTTEPPPRRSPRFSLGVPEEPAWRTAPAATGWAVTLTGRAADALAAAELSSAADRPVQPLSRTTAYSTNGLRITS